MTEILEYPYIATLYLAVITGIIVFSRITSPPVRRVFILVVYTTVLETSVIFFREKFSTDTNVLPQYNFFMLIEFLFYAWFFKGVINIGAIKKSIDVFLLLFPVLWYIFVFGFFNISQWNSYTFLLGGSCMVFFGLTYYYQLFKWLPPNYSIARSSEFWITTGIMIFYTTGVPYMGMYNFLSSNFEWLAQSLKPVLQVTNIIMYSLFAYAFICQVKMTNTTRSSL
ncbi:hypothetical protein [Niabella drilacis]|uniref:Uncharacterized protein n=1 Tax=Niabella drilacis (strain DSM 25811 / CCM 8410 / CCUG 62505 / LMG 26954 / E90) TaxID=1285928 RepID=A0A1G6U915_NIADE|nr:hypothetical protein [Niabella drilacis]SDD37087.1 hypothetical protein SAMN04487894_108168 [Niabella drilacis]